MKKLSVRIAASLSLSLICLAASAHQSGDVIVRAGFAHVDPRDDSTSMRVGGTALGGTGAGVDSAPALGLTVGYMLTEHVGIELLAASPFEHDITAKGLGGLGIADVGSTRQLPPTLSVQYYFLDAGSAVRPYVGAGVNYTTFFDEKLSGEMKSVLQARNLELDDSVGVALQLGMDWQLGQRWLLNAAVWRIDIDTSASVDTALGEVKVDVDIDPWVYMVGVGYRF